MALGLRELSIRRGTLLALALVLALALSGIVALGVEVQRRLDVLTGANSDSVHWALSQLEVELMRLALQVETPNADPEALRLRLDIFHSRIRTVQDSPLYADLRALPAFGAPLQSIAAALDYAATAPEPQPVPLALPPALAADYPALLSDARQMSLAGVEFFAMQSDRQRGAVADTLRGLVLLAAGLFAALSALLMVLVRLYGISRRRSEALRLTSTRLSTIVDTSADAIVVATRSGRVLEFNPAAEAMFGYSRADALQMQTPDFFPAPCPVTGRRQTEGILLLPDTPDAAPAGRVEAEARRLGGAGFPVEVSMASSDSADGGRAMPDFG